MTDSDHDKSEREHGPPKENFAETLKKEWESAPTADKVYTYALELTDPTTVSKVADLANCSENDARRHLQRLAKIGVLSKDSDTFERNEAYFEWRRTQRKYDNERISFYETVERMRDTNRE